jgi:hypothetical protein
MPRKKLDVEQIGWHEQIPEGVSISGSFTVTGSIMISGLGTDSNVMLVGSNNNITSSNTLFIDEVNGRVGMNTSTPQEQFHIHGNNATLRLGNGNNTGEHSVKLELSEQADSSGNMNYGFSVGYNGSSNDFEIRRYQNGTTGTNVMTINRSSDVATFSNDVRISNHLALNCAGTTDPTGTPPLLNHAHIYSKLTGGTAEIFVQDSDGNVTQISPHNPEGEWQYFSKNIRTGKVVRINMEKMIRKLEEITGESFMQEWYE